MSSAEGQRIWWGGEGASSLLAKCLSGFAVSTTPIARSWEILWNHQLVKDRRTHFGGPHGLNEPLHTQLYTQTPTLPPDTPRLAPLLRQCSPSGLLPMPWSLPESASLFKRMLPPPGKSSGSGAQGAPVLPLCHAHALQKTAPQHVSHAWSVGTW